MINEEYKAMLGGKSVIRELSEYATSRGAEIGYQNVFDYSLGNPSVPAPKSFTDAMVDLYENGDPVAIHGYSPSLGIPSCLLYTSFALVAELVFIVACYGAYFLQQWVRKRKKATEADDLDTLWVARD